MYIRVSVHVSVSASVCVSVRVCVHAPVTPGLRPGFDLGATETIWNRGQFAERTYDWSHRSWVIARAKSVAAMSMVMFTTSNL